MRQHFRQSNRTAKPFYKKRVIARDQYARRKRTRGMSKEVTSVKKNVGST